MRVLLLGASGFIGAATLARLRSEGHHIVAVTRSRQTAARLPADSLIILDISQATKPSDWLPHLKGVEAVVNCAGALQDGARDNLQGVHVDGMAALFAACEDAGVRRVIHVSAIGVDRGPSTAFAQTKRQAEQALMGRDLDWVILRPSVVLGRAAYGGSALIRGLAALPLLPVASGWGALQVVYLDDLTRTIAFFLRREAPARLAIDIAGPERLSFVDIVRAYRRWLGWREARHLSAPGFLFDIAFKVGDLAGLLGWRSPVRSTAREELKRGAFGDNTEWRRTTGIEPTSLTAALAAEPASVQERWFAALYLVKPIAFTLFALFWIITGIVSLGPGWETGVSLLRDAGIGETLSPIAAAGGAIADIAIGLGILFRRTSRLALFAALALSMLYLVAGTIFLPRLWAEPLGPLLKIAPIMMLNLVLLAIRDDR